MMAIGLNTANTMSFQKRMRRKEMLDDLKEILYFFERMFLLIKFAVAKVLSLLTIPFWIIGIMGAYNFYKMITDTISNGIFFARSAYFGQAFQFLGIYLIYTFIKMALECHLDSK